MTCMNLDRSGWNATGRPGLASGAFFLVVMNCLGESNPDVEQPQAAAYPADKAVGNHGSQPRGSHEKMVVHPFRSPRKNHQKHAHNHADKPECQHRKPMQPELDTFIASYPGRPWRYLHRCCRSVPTLRGRQLRFQRPWRNCLLRSIRIHRHRVLPKIERVAVRVLQTHILSVRG